jgi:hypothetical protein
VEEGEDLGNSTLQEICGEVLWKALKPRAMEKILVIDRERICGSRSCSLETWHSRRIESVDSLELPEAQSPRVDHDHWLMRRHGPLICCL